MRKFTIALLAITYLTISSGVAMTVHYCMGKIASVNLMDKSETCGKCGMKTADGCCTDEFTMVKLSDSHKLINNDIKIYSPVAVIDNSGNHFVTNIFESRLSNFKNHLPPESSGIPLNILYCVYRI